MIEASAPRLPANPPSAEVELTQQQIWQALVWKAEFAHLFVKPIKECRILERFDDGFLREIHHEDSQGDDILYERVFLDPQHSVRFLRLNGPVLGEIVNTIRTDGELRLDFSFTLALVDEPHGSPKEQDYREEFLSGYVVASNNTLDAAREYARTGVDPTLAASGE